MNFGGIAKEQAEMDHAAYVRQAGDVMTPFLLPTTFENIPVVEECKPRVERGNGFTAFRNAMGIKRSEVQNAVRALSKTSAPAPAAKVEPELPEWWVIQPGCPAVKVRAASKSEARGAAKKQLKVDRLVPQTEVFLRPN